MADYLCKVGKDCTITFKNGVIETDGRGFYIEGGTVNLENIKMTCAERCAGVYTGTLNIDEDCVLTSTGGDDVTIFYNSTNRDSESTIICKGKVVNNCKGEEGNFCISGNGSAPKDLTAPLYETKLELSGSAEVIANYGPAIYQPQKGTIYIHGAAVKVEGYSAIHNKCGRVVVDSGTLIGNQPDEYEYKYNGNGTENPGNAIVMDFCDYPHGAPSLVINDGVFISKYNNRAVNAYRPKVSKGVLADGRQNFVAGSSGYNLDNPSMELSAFVEKNIKINGGRFLPK